jgi:hypothetical protein
MRTFATLSSVRSSRKPLVGIVVFAIVLLLAYQAAEIVLSGDLTLFGYAGVLVFVVVVVITILNDWRRGVYILAAWLLFEDFARKFLGNNMAIYFAKDGLTLVLYLAFFRAQHAEKAKTLQIPFKLPLLALVWFGLIQVFNPASTSIFYGILGMKIYFLYVPLIFVGHAFLQSEKDLQRFLSFNSVLVLAIASLGLAQSIIGPTFLNPSNLQEDIRELSTTYRVAPISGLISYRPTSVFVSAGRFQDFLIISWIISLGYAGYLLLRNLRGRSLAFLTVGMVAAASVMSASRGVFMWNSGSALIVVGGFLWGAPWRQGQVMRTIRALQRATLIVGIAIVLLLTIFPEEIGSRFAIYSETLLPSSSASELEHRTSTYPIQQLRYAFDHPRWPYGYGIGTCTLGGQYVVRILHAQPMGIGVESGYGNLVVELGVVGLALWVVLGVSISFFAWKATVKLKGTPWFPIGFVIFLFSVLLFFPMTYASFSMFQDYVLSAYFWLFTGILYRLLFFRNAYQLGTSSGSFGRV